MCYFDVTRPYFSYLNVLAELPNDVSDGLYMILQQSV